MSSADALSRLVAIAPDEGERLADVTAGSRTASSRRRRSRCSTRSRTARDRHRVRDRSPKAPRRVRREDRVGDVLGGKDLVIGGWQLAADLLPDMGDQLALGGSGPDQR
jgi:hypothetical protein